MLRIAEDYEELASATLADLFMLLFAANPFFAARSALVLDLIHLSKKVAALVGDRDGNEFFNRLF
jgi:hypothetical protein